MYKGDNDGVLVDALRLGDKAAMAEIYHRYWRKLLAIALNQTKDKNAAEEIVQSVLVYLWDKRETIQIDSLPNYLASAIKYTFLTTYRLERRRNEIAYSIHNPGQSEWEYEKIYARFLEEFIHSEADKLPEKCKLVFQYSRIEGKNNAEIAAELNIAEKTVEAHLTKALKSLRLSLRDIGLLVFLFLLYK